MLSLPITVLLLVAAGITTYTTILWVRHEKQRKGSQAGGGGAIEAAEEGASVETIGAELSLIDATAKPTEGVEKAEPLEHRNKSTDEPNEAIKNRLYEQAKFSPDCVEEAKVEILKEPEKKAELAKTNPPETELKSRSLNKGVDVKDKETKSPPSFTEISLEEALKRIKSGEAVLESSPPTVTSHAVPIGYEPVSDFEQLTRPYHYPIVKMPFPNSNVLYPKEYKSKKQGVSEGAFHKVLLKAFGKKIKRNLSLDFEGAKHDYEPDFAFVDTDYELFVDIEVDEPYSGVSRKPMHFEGSYDQDRDRYFNQNGWVVIRFTEEQVVTQPLSCCHFVGSVLNALILDYNYDEEQAALLQSVRQWTYAEAEQMALEGFRESYLGITFEQVLDESPKNIESERELELQEPILDENAHITKRSTLQREVNELENKERLDQLLDKGKPHITFTYLSTQRLIEAHKVRQDRLSWILEGYDYVKSNTTNFDLGKIENIREIDSPFLFEAEEVSTKQFRDYIEIANDNSLYVQVHYQKRNGESTTRTLSYFQRDFIPGETRWWYTKNLYVRAFCNLRKDDRTFKFDRIQWMRVLNLSY